MVQVLNLQPEVVHLHFARGDTFTFEFVLLDRATGKPVDLTGSTLALTVNPAEDGSGSDLFALSPTNTPAVQGLVQFKPTAGQMTQTAATYYYDLEWTLGTSVRTVARGQFVIGPEIS